MYNKPFIVYNTGLWLMIALHHQFIKIKTKQNGNNEKMHLWLRKCRNINL